MYLNGREMKELLEDLQRLDPQVAEKWRGTFTAAAWLRRNQPQYPKGGPAPTLMERLRYVLTGVTSSR